MTATNQQWARRSEEVPCFKVFFVGTPARFGGAGARPIGSQQLRVRPSTMIPQNDSQTGRIDWQSTPWCFVEAPTCPACGSPQYRTTKSVAAGEGVITRKAVCGSCGRPFRICVSLPEFGIRSSVDVTMPSEET